MTALACCTICGAACLVDEDEAPWCRGCLELNFNGNPHEQPRRRPVLQLAPRREEGCHDT